VIINIKYQSGDDTLDTCNIDSIRRFFDNHKDYNFYELVLKYGIKPSTLKGIRAKAGIKSDTKQSNFLRSHKPKTSERVLPSVTDRAIWDNKEWLTETNKKYGIVAIAKITGKYVWDIQRRFKKYNIRAIPLAERLKKNKYDTDEWINDSYFVKNLQIETMAKIAGVSIYTIYDWLVARNIYPRDLHTSNAYRNWCIKSAKKLEEYNKKYGTKLQSIREIPDSGSEHFEDKA
jgi:hypothetical protein